MWENARYGRLTWLIVQLFQRRQTFDWGCLDRQLVRPVLEQAVHGEVEAARQEQVCASNLKSDKAEEPIVNLLRRRRSEAACREGSHQEWWLCEGRWHQQWWHVEVLHRWQSWNQGLCCQPVSSPSRKDNFFSFDINIGLILICSRQFHSRLVQFQCLWCPCCSLPVYSCSISGASTTGPRPISH